MGKSFIHLMTHSISRLSLGKMTPKNNKATTLYSKVNILMLGAGKTGKTSLVKRLLSLEFQDKYKPTVYDVFHHPLDCERGHFLLQFTDFAGVYSFPPMRRLAIKQNDIFVLVYNVTDSNSLEEIERLQKEIIELKGEQYCQKYVIVVGNKSDCTNADLHHVAESMNGSSLLTSARTGYNIDRLSQTLKEESAMLVCRNTKAEMIT